MQFKGFISFTKNRADNGVMIKDVNCTNFSSILEFLHSTVYNSLFTYERQVIDRSTPADTIRFIDSGIAFRNNTSQYGGIMVFSGGRDIQF